MPTQTETPAKPEFTMPKGDALLKVSFAELEDVAANHEPEFDRLVKGITKLAEKKGDISKELTEGSNFYGKVLAILGRRYDAGIACGAIKAQKTTFKDHVTANFGTMPARAYSSSNVFICFVLSDAKSPRHIAEEMYNGFPSRLINGTSKIVNIASDNITGETPETSGLNHQVFADVAVVLKRHDKNSVEDLERIQARLVWDEKVTDGVTTRKLLYISEKELQDRIAAANQTDSQGVLLEFVKAHGWSPVIAALLVEARTTGSSEVAQSLVHMAAEMGDALAENTTETAGADGKPVKVRRFTPEQIDEWTEEAKPALKFEELSAEQQSVAYAQALETVSLFEAAHPAEEAAEAADAKPRNPKKQRAAV